MGAVDYIIKPFSEPVLQHRIKTQLDIDQIVKERTAKLNRIQNGIVSVLADIVENRDKGAGGHIERTSGIIGILIEAMKENGVYIEEIRDWDTERMVSSARMHDLGKVSVSDTIVNKPGKLTEEEFETMKAHSLEGERIIDEIVAITGEGSFLHNAKLFAGYHHERWDGKGYPRGLKGTEIPLQGRIMALVDVYDAIISVRPYKNALPHEEAVEIIKSVSGTQLDPAIVDVFLSTQEKIIETIKSS
jgi:putative two-component system response regulator